MPTQPPSPAAAHVAGGESDAGVAGVPLPRSVRVGGLTYRVDEVANPWGNGHSGLCHLRAGQVLVDAHSAPDVQRSTLLHECLEIINWTSDLRLKHRQIMALEHAIDALLAGNPDLVALYSEETVRWASTRG